MFLTIMLTFIMLFISSFVTPKLKAKWSGKRGEGLVSDILKLHGFTVFDDLLFQLENRTVQIDHLAVSPRGILVVESKNHHGTIIGNAYEREWLQSLGKNTYPFYNPVWQNYGHRKTVETLLGVSEDKIISIVVFASNPELLLNKADNIILTAGELHTWLLDEQTPRLTDEEVNMLCRRIRELNCNSRKAMKVHIQNIQSKKAA